MYFRKWNAFRKRGSGQQIKPLTTCRANEGNPPPFHNLSYKPDKNSGRPQTPNLSVNCKHLFGRYDTDTNGCHLIASLRTGLAQQRCTLRGQRDNLSPLEAVWTASDMSPICTRAARTNMQTSTPLTGLRRDDERTVSVESNVANAAVKLAVSCQVWQGDHRDCINPAYALGKEKTKSLRLLCDKPTDDSAFKQTHCRATNVVTCE